MSSAAGQARPSAAAATMNAVSKPPSVGSPAAPRRAPTMLALIWAPSAPPTERMIVRQHGIGAVVRRASC
jgi:hypothetical protein